jgi:biotin carboxylase
VNIDELQEYVLKVGFPLVLKADGTCGGDGVKIARTLSEAEQAYRNLKAPVQLARAVKRAIVNHDKTLIWPSVLRRSNNVSGQAYVPGQEATSTIACWNGVVLAALHFEVIKKKHAAGHATVMQLIDHHEMSSAVEKIVRRLNLSGVHGFDFMLESSTGRAFLIEMNPRTTQVGHLTLGEGRDIPAALVAAISGTTLRLAPKLTEKEVIALFPQEWARDPRSSYIRSGYHDVPWGEPALLDACVRNVRKQQAVNEHGHTEFGPLPANRAVPVDPVVPTESLMVRSGDSRYE